VWANMYDDTVHYATGGRSTLLLSPLGAAPREGNQPRKIEPEVVVKLKRPIGPEVADAAAVLDAIEWLAIGFEIVDCPYPGWQFKPADLVATWGFHTALVVGGRLEVDRAMIPALAEDLSRFTIRLLKNGALVAEGSGQNVLGSPALCVAEVASAVTRQAGARPLTSDEIISTGSLTAPQLVQPGETWRAEVQGLAAPDLELRFT